ncbi:MAG: DNA primase [Candidatus Paceibacterota bacterium]
MQPDSVQQIKDKLSIIEVITPYVKLTRAGKYWRGLSPFGKEKTPSFYVNPERGSYFCFSTSQGGDHFTFIQIMEGVDFKGALKILAEKAGIELKALRPEDTMVRDRADRLREMVAQAESFFASTLEAGTPAHDYALKRGLTLETIKDWKLGFAPAGWRGLLEALGTQGYIPKELAEAGLVKEADEKPGTWYDRFRNRLMFPIRDAAGRTVAFTGRALDPADNAKYLNSPETGLFKKSEVLFGMDKAKDAIRSRGFAILVEGQFDLLLLHQAGFQNTIALSGTALSSQHLSLIKRYADNLMLCLDGDRAGLAASAKNARAALMAGMRVKAVRLPEGKDPADVVSEDENGPKVFSELVKNSQSVIEFFLAVLSASERDEFKLLRQVEAIVLPLVVAVKSPLERNRYVDIVARTLSSTPEAVRASLPRPEEVPHDAADAVDMRKGTVSPASMKISGLESRRSLIFATIKSYPDSPLAERLKSEYNRIIGAPVPIEVDLDERALFEAGLVFGESPEADAANDLIYTFERMILMDALREATLKLRRAEASNDPESIQAASIEARDVSTRLSQLP